MKLASIQKILNLEPIEGADNIEKATVLGWSVVVKKGEFKIGDLCCYIQIDTVVPETEQFEFLRSKKFRVTTIKLRKQISQGLIIPISKSWKGGLSEGDDVTGYVGVKKYEKIDNNPNNTIREAKPKLWYKKWIYLFKHNILFRFFPSLEKRGKLPFPSSIIHKTDEERIQNMPKMLEKYKDKEFVVSYKLDGSSITVIHEKKFCKSKFRICSRNWELTDNKNDWYNVFKGTNFDQEILKLVKFYNTDNIIVQGEMIGKFNGNHHNLPTNQIRLFNIHVDGKRIKQDALESVCKSWNIPYCPVYTKVILNHTMEEILAMSEIKDILNPKSEAEGLVWRCVEDNFSFKVINNKYLLKNGE